MTECDNCYQQCKRRVRLFNDEGEDGLYCPRCAKELIAEYERLKKEEEE